MWVAYVSLFGIALYHNGGLAGLTFRLTLGVVLVYTSAEAGLLASIRTEGQADKNIYKDWHIKGYSRKLARQSAMADLESTARMQQIDREAIEKVYVLQKMRQTEEHIRDIKSGGSLDKTNVVETRKSTVSTNSLDAVNQKRRLSKQQALDRTLQILSRNPATNPSEIAEQIGKSRQTV